MISPLQVAWVTAGSPLTEGLPKSEQGVCAVTGEVGAVYPSRTVLSNLFTAWDRLGGQTATIGLAMCWAVSRQSNHVKTQPYVVTHDTAHHPTLPQLRETLIAPVSPDIAVTIPISQQVHTLPWAQWGTVTTDRDQHDWTTNDAALFAVFCRWRDEYRVSEKAWPEPSCPWWIAREHPELVAEWSMFDPWRERPSKLLTAIRAARTPKETKEQE